MKFNIRKKNETFEEPLLSGTYESAKDFFEHSPVWRDLHREFNIWLDEIHNQLENGDGNFSHRQLDRLGGNAETLRNVLSEPLVYLEKLKMQAERK